MAQEETRLIHILHDDVDLIFAAASKEVAEEMKTRLDEKYLQITPMQVTEKIPEKIFVVVTLTRDSGEEDALNYWFSDSPYDEDFVYIDSVSFEVGVLTESVQAALAVATAQWEAYTPADGADWPAGELPLAEV